MKKIFFYILIALVIIIGILFTKSTFKKNISDVDTFSKAIDSLSITKWKPQENTHLDFLDQIRDTFLITKKYDLQKKYGIYSDTINIFINPVHISNKLFQERLNKKASFFQNPLIISYSTFRDTVYDLKEKPKNVKQAGVPPPTHSSPSFSNNIFNSSVIFEENEYKSNLGFDITESVFGGGLFFTPRWEDTISCEILIASCTFYNSLDFNKKGPYYNGIALYDKSIIFRNDFFNNTVDLSNCSLLNNSTVIFDETPLPDTLDFSNSNLSATIDLTTAFPNYKEKKCQINLLNTNIEKILMQYNNFHLFIPDSLLNAVNSKDIVNSTYESLLNNFKKNGFNESYKKLDIEYKEWQSNDDWTFMLSNWWWRFGYEKWRILIITFGLMLIFSLFNYKNYSKLQKVYPVESLNIKSTQYSSNKIAFSLRKHFMVLLYTGLIFFRLSIDFKNLKFSPLRYVAIIIAEYAVGLVCTGFLINWILKG